MKCKKCDYIWESRPSSISTGSGCPICKGIKQRKTHEEFMKEIKDKKLSIEVLGKYTTKRTKIKCRCKICNYIWDVMPQSLLYGKRCPKCVNNLRMTHDEFVEKINQVNPSIKIVSEYKSFHSDVKCLCLKHNYEWKTKAYNLARGTGCPLCNSSKGERIIEQFLKANFLQYRKEYKINECKYKRALPFDFAILNNEKLIALIEYQGEQHYNPVRHFGVKNTEERFKNLQMRDSIKRNFCKENNIKLIEIPYWIKEIETYLLEQLKNK